MKGREVAHEVDQVFEVGVFRYFLTNAPRTFIFYEDEEGEVEGDEVYRLLTSEQMDGVDPRPAHRDRHGP